ncbi:MAG: hypothetical protein GF335_04460 [Candidatus Moranbacteria bacterium]|nr:hypothetical protein [Candidatus Moranbacteria bacterium]
MKKKSKDLLSLLSLGGFLILAIGSVDSDSQNGNVQKELTPSDVDQAAEEAVEEAEKRVGDYFSDDSDWKKFNSPIGQFEVLFPKYPSHRTQEVTVSNTGVSVDMEEYTSKKDDSEIYSLFYNDYPKSIDLTSNPKSNLENSLNAMLSSVEGSQLISSKISDYGKHKALDFVLKVPQEELMVKGRIILAGQEMYQLYVTYQKDKNVQKNYQRFINSFEILK